MKKIKSIHLVYDINDGEATYTDTLAYDGDKYDTNMALLKDLKSDIDNIVIPALLAEE